GLGGLQSDRARSGTPDFRPAADPAEPPPLYPHEQDGGSMPPPHDDEFYDDAPRGGRAIDPAVRSSRLFKRCRAIIEGCGDFWR
ncbi:MAG: hypothetical protein ABL893_12795, partial [Hyphomicrobium sp.]